MIRQPDVANREPNMTIYDDLHAYLASHGAFDITTCTLRIGRHDYPAARYLQRHATPPGSPAYVRGEREYLSQTIMAVGKLPSFYRRSSKVCFTMADAVHEWFVAGYAGAIANRVQADVEPSDINPFGNTFLVSPWNLSEPIDRYERNQYRRVPIELRNQFRR